MATKKTTDKTEIAKIEPAAQGLIAVEEVRKQIQDWSALLDGYSIPDDDEFAAAGDFAKKFASAGKRLEAEYNLAVAPLKAEIAKRDALFKPLMKVCKTQKDKIKGLIGTYMLQKREAQRALAAAAVSAPVTATGGASSQALMKESREAAAPSLLGVSGKVKMKWEVVDFDALPNEYKMIVVDEAAIQQAVDAGVTTIEGVTIEEDMAVRIVAGARG